MLLPIVFLVIFAAIFKGTTIVDGRAINITTFYVPGIMTLGIISASYVNLTQAVVTQRESGELKRLRGTPLPASFVISSRAAVGVVVAIVMSALLLLLGARRLRRADPALDDARAGPRGGRRGRRVRRASRSRSPRASRAADAAAPATNLTVLPLYFISGVFVPESQIPKYLRDIATVFPI